MSTAGVELRRRVADLTPDYPGCSAPPRLCETQPQQAAKLQLALYHATVMRRACVRQLVSGGHRAHPALSTASQRSKSRWGELTPHLHPCAGWW